MRHVWMPPVMQVFSADKLGIVISCGHVSGLDEAAFHEPRACMEMRGSGPHRVGELEALHPKSGCSDPVSVTVAPYPRRPMEMGGSSPNQKCELVGSLSHAGCFDPVLLTVFPYLFCEFLTSSTSSGGWSVV